MKGAGELYRLLGDEVRLRLLRVLAGKHGRLNVTELTAVLGIAQSGVSTAGLPVSGRRSTRSSPKPRTRRPCAATNRGCRK